MARSAGTAEGEEVAALRRRISELEQHIGLTPQALPELGVALSRVSDAVVSFDADWRFVYLNARAAESFGRPVADLLGKDFWEEFPVAIDQPFFQHHRRAMAEQVPITVEEYYPPRDRWYRTNLYPSPSGLTVFFQDVTERKQVEAALRAAEDRYRLLIEQAPDAIFIADGDLRYVEVNERACELSGYSREELLQLDVRSLIAPDDLTTQPLRLSELPGGSAIVTERQFRRSDGTLIPVQASSRLLADGRLQTIVRDIRERKNAEAERASILERVSDAFVALDTNWRYTYVNQKAAQIFGRTREELVGRHIWTEFPEGVDHPFHQAYERAMSEQSPQLIEEYYPPYDRWFENRIYPSINGLSIFFHDITAQKKAEIALRLSEERFRLMVEQSNDVVLMFDHTGIITYISPAVERVLGHAPSDLVGQAVWSLLVPDELPMIESIFARLSAESGGVATAEHSVLHRDGSWKRVAATGVSRFDDPAINALIAFWHDVTDERRTAQTLRDSAVQLRRLAQHVQEARENEQAQIAREIHDRLGGSLTLLKLEMAQCLSRLPPLEPELRDSQRRLLAEVDAIIAVVREISADVRPPLLDDLGLGAALEWACQRFTDRTNIPCALELEADDVPIEVGRVLYAIAQEAFTNIIRHADAHRVTVRLTGDGDDVALGVEDDGCGFDLATLAGSTRLGVVGMRERAAAVGGTLTVNSTPGTGTTVTARVPLAREEQSEQ